MKRKRPKPDWTRGELRATWSNCPIYGELGFYSRPVEDEAAIGITYIHVVIHVRTGMGLGHYSSEALAREVVETLEPLLDWSKVKKGGVDPTKETEIRKLLAEFKLREIPSHTAAPEAIC